jgi:hypothetical protein
LVKFQQNSGCLSSIDCLILFKIMRPKFVFAVLLFGLLASGTIIFLKQQSSAPAVSAAPTPAPAASAVPTPAPAPAPVVKKTLTPEERQAAIDKETDRLSSWGMNDDSASLSNILADLANPEKAIRAAAVEAAKQFGSTNAIPALKAAVNDTDDTQEKIALLEAADFLSLPDAILAGKTGTDQPQTPEQIQAQAQQKAKHDARRQAQMQKHAGPNSPATPNQ